MKRPLLIRRVVGHSMEPDLRPNQVLIASGWLKPQINDLVIAGVHGLEVVKRVQAIAEQRIALSGERHGHYATVQPGAVKGRVLIAL